jgi:hypothetical protein
MNRKQATIFMIVFSMLLLFQENLFGQSRSNAPLPIVIDTGRELSNLTGWNLDAAGQWQSWKNVIPGYYSSIYKLHKMKLYTTSYNDKDYILLVLVIPDTRYRYPNIRVDPYTVHINRIYIFEKQDFRINLTPNENIINSLKIYAGLSITEYGTDIDLGILTIQKEIAPVLRNPSIDVHGISSVLDDNFVFFSYYYEEDNVMRFAFSSYIVKSMPETSYFECNFDEYKAFFNPFDGD